MSPEKAAYWKQHWAERDAARREGAPLTRAEKNEKWAAHWAAKDEAKRAATRSRSDGAPFSRDAGVPIVGEVSAAHYFMTRIDAWHREVPLDFQKFPNGTPFFRLGIEPPYGAMLVPVRRKWRLVLGDEAPRSRNDEYWVGEWQDDPAKVLGAAFAYMNHRAEEAMNQRDFARAYHISRCVVLWSEALDWMNVTMAAGKTVVMLLLSAGEFDRARGFLGMIDESQLDETGATTYGALWLLLARFESGEVQPNLI